MAIDAARAAGDLARSRVNDALTIEFKEEGNYNLVTEMDVACEKLIKGMITERMGRSRFLAEESGGDQDHDLTELTWVVDPIDGTVNYAHRVPIYSVSIAAVRENKPIIGVVYNPTTGELFTAIAGRGGFFEDQSGQRRRMKVSTTSDIQRSVLVTGFPYNVEENPFGCIDAFVEIIRRGIPVRRLGSAALDLAYVADGRFDAYWEVTLHEWDVAAGVLMVSEAGGHVDTYAPTEPTTIIVTDRILATNGLVHGEVKRIITGVM